MDFIRLTNADGPVVVARDAILTVHPVPGGTRITLRDSLTTVDVTDAPEDVADQLAPMMKAEAKKAEPEPTKALTK